MAKIKINDLPNNAARDLKPEDLAKINGGYTQDRLSLNYNYYNNALNTTITDGTSNTLSFNRYYKIT